MTRCVVLSSDNVAGAQSLLDSAYFREIPDFELVAVVTSRQDSHVSLRAKTAGVKCYAVDRDVFPNDATYQKALLEKLLDLDADLVVVSDFAPGIPASIAQRFKGRILLAGLSLTGETGVSIYLADAAGSPGRVVSSMPVAIKRGDPPADCVRKLLDGVNALITPAVKRWCAGEL